MRDYGINCDPGRREHLRGSISRVYNQRLNGTVSIYTLTIDGVNEAVVGMRGVPRCRFLISISISIRVCVSVCLCVPVFVCTICVHVRTRAQVKDLFLVPSVNANCLFNPLYSNYYFQVTLIYRVIISVLTYPHSSYLN